VGHICGAKDVIKAIQDGSPCPGSDCSVILGWVYYHDVLARFTLRHWRTYTVRQSAALLGYDPNMDPGCAVQYLIARSSFTAQIPIIATYAHQVLRLLCQIFSTLLSPWTPEYHSEEYRDQLHEIKLGLKNSSCTAAIVGKLNPEVIDDVARALELFRLAGLVYLERASRNFSGQSDELDQWTEEAFAILESSKTCQQAWPLFIFGLEAHTDERRLTILDIIANTERGPHHKNMQLLRAVLQCAWTHRDLTVDGDVEYIRTLDLVLSSSDEVPSFA
jgi:hypothetical protein